MNKYEQYQITKATATPTIGPMYISDIGLPVYTREQAIALAADLPGCACIYRRMLWLRTIPDGFVVESNPSGLSAIPPSAHGRRYFNSSGRQ